MKLTREQKLAVYNEIQLEYDIMDAKNHCEEMEINFLKEEDFLELAKWFQKKKDCNLPDNDVWEYLIDDYVKTKLQKIAG